MHCAKFFSKETASAVCTMLNVGELHLEKQQLIPQESHS
jgi:hypothetical protein